MTFPVSSVLTWYVWALKCHANQAFTPYKEKFGKGVGENSKVSGESHAFSPWWTRGKNTLHCQGILSTLTSKQLDYIKNIYQILFLSLNNNYRVEGRYTKSFTINRNAWSR